MFEGSNPSPSVPFRWAENGPALYTLPMETDQKPVKSGSAVKKAKSQARILILVAAFLSLIASVVLYFTGSENEGIFIGLWVPSILALGALLVPAGSD